MRILYFHQHFSTPAGAAGTRSYEMAQRLIAREHQVTMVCGSYGAGSTGLTAEFQNGRRRGFVDGIDVVEYELTYSNRDGFLKRTSTFIKFAIKSVWFALREPCDLVFATTTPLTAGIPGIVARWLMRRKFVFEVRDLWPELPRAMGVIRNPVILGAMSLLEFMSYRSATLLIGLSPGIVDGIAKRGVDRSRIAMIPNGCDLSIFSDSVRPTLPKEISENDFVAVFTGTHGIANGLDAVIDAARVLKERAHTDIKLLLIGQGQLKPRLMERAQSENLQNVVFMDPVPKTELSGIVSAADVGLQILANVPAFYYGTSPNKFFDYISAGKAVLINYPGWLAGFVEAERCGIVVPPEDPVAFAEALIEAADDRTGVREMGIRGRALAERVFNRDLLGDQFCDWLESSQQP